MNKKIMTQDDVNEYLSTYQQLRDKILLEDIPVVKFLENKILNRIELKPQSFDMSVWHAGKVDVYQHKVVGFELDDRRVSVEKALEVAHKCGTTHCRAGWAVAIAGRAGWELEKRVGANLAGRLIYLRSVGYLPSFLSSSQEALSDIKSRASAEFSKKDKAFAKKGGGK